MTDRQNAQARLDTLRAAADRAMTVRYDIGVHIVAYGSDRRSASVEVTRHASGRCGRCGQSLATMRPGPVDWIDERTGDVQGGWNWQHGCGEWNTPQHERTAVNLAEDIDPEGVIAALVAAVDAAVAAERAASAQRIEADLRRTLAAALAEIAAGADPDDVRTGSALEPGVYVEGDEWVAWDYDPEYPGETLTITETDLH